MGRPLCVDLFAAGFVSIVYLDRKGPPKEVIMVFCGR